MINIIWAAIVWLLILVIIPRERLQTLWKAGLLTFIWVFFIDYAYTQLGYYKFAANFNIFGLPLFYLIGSTGGGLLMINWIPREPLYKLINVIAFSTLLSLSERVYVAVGGFYYVSNFTPLLSFTLNIAGLSSLTFLALAVIGEEEIYSGPRSRWHLKNVV